MFVRAVMDKARVLRLLEQTASAEMQHEQGGDTGSVLHRSVLFAGVVAVIAAFAWNVSYTAAAVFLIAIFFVQSFLAHRAQQNRALAFEKDFPSFLLALASGIRTGLDTLQAVASVRAMYPDSSELGKELGVLCEKFEVGIPEEAALLEFGKEIQHPDIQLFAAAVVLSRQQGSSLSQCLQRLTRVTRNRQAFRRKSRGAVAMQRLSAFGIAGCSVLIAGMQIAMNAKSFMEAWHHPIGSKMQIAGILLLVLGLAWMLVLGRRRI